MTLITVVQICLQKRKNNMIKYRYFPPANIYMNGSVYRIIGSVIDSVENFPNSNL